MRSSSAGGGRARGGGRGRGARAAVQPQRAGKAALRTENSTASEAVRKGYLRTAVGQALLQTLKTYTDQAVEHGDNTWGLVSKQILNKFYESMAELFVGPNSLVRRSLTLKGTTSYRGVDNMWMFAVKNPSIEDGDIVLPENMVLLIVAGDGQHYANPAASAAAPGEAEKGKTEAAVEEDDPDDYD